jgi:hypothetical protein
MAEHGSGSGQGGGRAEDHRCSIMKLEGRLSPCVGLSYATLRFSHTPGVWFPRATHILFIDWSSTNPHFAWIQNDFPPSPATWRCCLIPQCPPHRSSIYQVYSQPVCNKPIPRCITFPPDPLSLSLSHSLASLILYGPRFLVLSPLPYFLAFLERTSTHTVSLLVLVSGLLLTYSLRLSLSFFFFGRSSSVPHPHYACTTTPIYYWSRTVAVMLLLFANTYGPSCASV